MQEIMKKQFEKEILWLNNPNFIKDKNLSREFWKKINKQDNKNLLKSTFDTLLNWDILNSVLNEKLNNLAIKTWFFWTKKIKH